MSRISFFIFLLCLGLSQNIAAQQPAVVGEAQNGVQSSQPAASANPAPAPAGAPSDRPVYTMRVNSRLVVLDMVVVNKKGEVVRDLKREDFHVEENGEPQAIQNFEVSGAHAAAPDAKIESTADLDRLAPRAPVDIILLDEFNTRFEDMAFARYSLKKYLAKQPDVLPAPTMLIAVDLQHFNVLRDYTRNKDEILSALDHHFSGYPWQLHNYSWVAERYGTAFVTLRRVAEAVMGHPGHKNMIWIGRGFPSINWSNVPIDSSQRVETAVQACVNILRDARVTLYTIDPAGVQMNPGVYGGCWMGSDPFGGNYEFNRLAKATGGRSLFGRNDVDMEINTAIQDGSNFYTLTYRPTNGDPDPKKFRRIKVTVNRPDLTVITREGYYLGFGPGRVNPENPSRRLMMDLNAADNSNMTYDGVRFTVERSATDRGHFVLHIDGHNLVWSPATETEARHSEIVIVGSTFDKKGKELDGRRAQMVHSDAPKNAPPTGRVLIHLKIPFDMKVDSKAVRARFTVRVSATGRIGTYDVDLTKPVEAPAEAVPNAAAGQEKQTAPAAAK